MLHQRTFNWLSVAIAACLIGQILLTSKLWTSASRKFPTVPVFEYIELSWITVIDFPLYILLLSFLASIMLFKQSPIPKICFLLLSTLLVLQDITRLQVWFFQLASMLTLLTIGNEKNERAVLTSLQIIMIAIYCWSGIHKFNIYFTDHTLPWLLEKPELLQSLSEYKFLSPLIATFECSLGIALFFRPSRRIAVGLAILFHMGILLILGPFGHNWNEVVWPWNIVMIVMVYWLFYPNTEKSDKNFRTQMERFPLLIVIILLFGCMPLLNFYYCWDEQLSFKMYAGANPEGVFFFDPEDIICFPEHLKADFFSTDPKRITLDDWAFKELKVPPYFSERSMLQIGKQLCPCLKYPEKGGIDLIYFSRKDPSEDVIQHYSCQTLIEN